MTNKKARRTHMEEFKNQIVQLYLNGKRKCDISTSLLATWIKQSQTTGSFKEKDNRSDAENELIALRKRNKQLEMENDILKQATLIFGRK